jgi:hypothetical protein
LRDGARFGEISAEERDVGAKPFPHGRRGGTLLVRPNGRRPVYRDR